MKTLIGNKRYKRKVFTSKANLFPFLVVGLCIATSLMMASFFSSIITTNGLGFITSLAKTQSSTVVWAISVGTSSTFSQAEELAETTKTRNGGGVIYKTDVFHVLASAYEIENDALKVQTNLEAQDITSQILKIEVPQTSVSSTYTVSEVSALDASLTAYREAYRTLFDLSISLDTATKTELTVREAIVKLKNKLTDINDNFALQLNKKLTANLVALSLQNEKTLAFVNELTTTTNTLSSMTKSAYLNILTSQEEMLASLQTRVF